MSAGKGGLRMHGAAVEQLARLGVLDCAVPVHAAVQVMNQSEVAAWQDRSARDCLMQLD